MLSVQTIQLLLTGGVVGGVLGFLGAIPYLKKKGVNLGTGIDKAKQVVNIVGTTLDAIEPILPPAIANNLEYIEKWAKIAVGKADQLYHAGEIEKDDRQATAEQVVDELLKELNIIPSESMKALINASILNAVNESGHKDKTESQKEAEKQVLVTQNQQLQANVQQLQQKITQIQSAVQTA